MWWLLLLLLVLDGAKLAVRARSLATLKPSADPIDGEHRFFAAPGVALDESTRRSASAYARQHGLLALDLWPPDLPTGTVLGLLARFDPTTWRHDRLALPQGPGQAALVHASVVARMGEPSAPTCAADVHAIVERARLYATPATDVVVAPTLRAAPEATRDRRALFAHAHSDRVGGILGAQLFLLALLLYGPISNPLSGFACLLVYGLQPVAAFAGTPFAAARWLPYAVLRPAWDLGRWAALVAGAWPNKRAAIAAARPTYAPLIADGVERFFGPVRSTCPACGGGDLRHFVRVPDLQQGKPGVFTLRTCGACSHVFQDPPLTPEGLAFYYRDFYEGPFAGGVEEVFRAMTRDYHARARAIADRARPATWLDVGTGQGHFPCAAKDVLPDCVFDGLDQVPAVEEAARRGWITTAYRTSLGGLAEHTTARWDALSMSHYLEHTSDPPAELAAAARVLNPGGHLLIEIPSSESPLGRALGWAWFPWFQPQHLHLPPVAVLKRWLDEAGFETVVVDRITPHHPVDLLLAVSLLTRRLAPDPNVPWRTPGPLARPWRALVDAIIGPWALGAASLDLLLLPLLRYKGWTNAVLVVARLRS